MNQLVTRSEKFPFLNSLKLKDSRLVDRLGFVIKKVSEEAHQSFPAIFPKKSDLDGFYRLVNNPRMEFQELTQAITRDTIQKIIDHQQLTLAIHDTSTFTFNKDPSTIEGIGPVSENIHGFLGHFCLAVNLQQEILGLLGIKCWVRGKTKKSKNKKTRRQDASLESLRWAELIRQVEQRIESKSTLIHVADREIDNYVTLNELDHARMRFVFRVNHNRNIHEDPTFTKLFDSLREATLVCEREVILAERKKKNQPIGRGKGHPKRSRRTARLGIAAKKIKISRAERADRKATPEFLELNFVRVFELDPPADETAVEWMLVTSESIDTPENLLQIVDIYRARWTIEEFFKALKSGCAYEKRGFENLHALLNCLAIFIPIACHLYNFKMLARTQPHESSLRVLSATQIEVLAHLRQQSPDQLQTLESVLWAIAGVGGHLKHNGPPGWQTLGRGFEKLLLLEQGWILANSIKMEHRDM